MKPELLLDGLHFAECPRWHDDRLWFVDVFGHCIMTLDESGRSTVIVKFEDGTRPAGLGFLPDGDLIVVDMSRPRILRVDPAGRHELYVDLSDLAVGELNDMVVDQDGRAYVGSLGTHSPDEPRPVDADGNIIVVEPDGRARIVEEEMDAPNGPAISVDGDLYVVAEFPSQRLIGFDRSPDGTLSRRRVWADLTPGSCDGLTIDCENGVWTASPLQGQCRRVVEGGEITDVIPVDHIPLACCLGGSEGRTLYILSAVGGVEAIRQRTNTSQIEAIEVSVPAWRTQ